jgi:hypothetical protein
VFRSEFREIKITQDTRPYKKTKSPKGGFFFFLDPKTRQVLLNLFVTLEGHVLPFGSTLHLDFLERKANLPNGKHVDGFLKNGLRVITQTPSRLLVEEVTEDTLQKCRDSSSFPETPESLRVNPTFF